ncbi:MAG: DNA-directed RNA polymerase subunit G [Candidatus Jordarchaeaceae archaeon]
MTILKTELTLTKIKPIEESNKIQEYHLTSEDEQIKITIELPKELLFLQEKSKTVIQISDQPLETKNTKLSLEGQVIRKTKTEDKYIYTASFGGLQVKIETPKEQKQLTPIRNIYLNIT